MWASHGDFLPLVSLAWNSLVKDRSCPLIIFAQKLKSVKNVLKPWNKNTFGNISQSVEDCRSQLSAIQSQLQVDPQNTPLGLEERAISSRLGDLLKQEESFFKQKSRIKWLTLGDSNTTYFHKSVRARQSLNSIYSIRNPDGSLLFDPDAIKSAFVFHFSRQFNPSTLNPIFPIPDDITFTKVPPDLRRVPSTIPSDEEIFGVINFHKSDKAPGPDGFSFGFFLLTWDIVKDDLFICCSLFLL
ncbi:uncharacterized protein LOC122093866 [Macadamia integrifolia]|uniref:uncharacterized protein LOC122093866 n=1 Tax=Macadamia integrifolia TaxID=60698 RepID=UPI001C530885|nr:uncharacterized protein LOC122093866 [Macadamia integrifolia]